MHLVLVECKLIMQVLLNFGQGNWNVESNSSSGLAKEGRSSNYNYMLYHPFPHNNVTTTPNRKRPNLDDTKACKACGSNTTPLWRKGPDGPQVSTYFLFN